MKILTCLALLILNAKGRILNYQKQSGHVDVSSSNLSGEPPVHLVNNLPTQSNIHSYLFY